MYFGLLEQLVKGLDENDFPMIKEDGVPAAG